MRATKLLACCSSCDELCFEVASRWTEGPYKGEVREVGRSLPHVRRLIIVRISGNTSFWTVCANCRVGPEDLWRINRKEIAAMVKEEWHGRSLRTPAQVQSRQKMLSLFVFDIPLGVLGEIPWSEVR